MIERLEWDSDFFGFEIGRIDLKSVEYFNYESFIQNSKVYKLIYIFSDQKLENKFLNLIDTKVTYSKKIGNDLVDDNLNEVDIKLFNKSTIDYVDYNALEQLALDSGIYSRFKLDPYFDKGAYESLYKKWINNIVYKEEETDIIIYKEGSVISGFTALKKIDDSLCDISLVAVSGSHRGKGVATNLINFTFSQALKRKFNFIQVVTQRINIPAVKLYQKCQFEIKKKQYIYHYWNL